MTGAFIRTTGPRLNFFTLIIVLRRFRGSLRAATVGSETVPWAILTFDRAHRWRAERVGRHPQSLGQSYSCFNACPVRACLDQSCNSLSSKDAVRLAQERALVQDRIIASGTTFQSPVTLAVLDHEGLLRITMGCSRGPRTTDTARH